MTHYMTIEDCLQKTHAVWIFITEAQIRNWTQQGYIGKVVHNKKYNNRYFIEVDKFVQYIKDRYDVSI